MTTIIFALLCAICFVGGLIVGLCQSKEANSGE